MGRKEYLVKWATKVIERKKDKNGVDITTTNFKVLNQKFADLLNLPMKIVAGNETTIIPKDVILCDGCNDVMPEFVATDGDYLYRTVCQSCKERYYQKHEVRKE